MADPPPQYLVWLPLMHRLANVENGTCCDWIVCGFLMTYFPSPTTSGHLTHKIWLKQGLRMPESLCAAVPQSSIQWNVRTAGVRAWWVSGTAASSAMATSFVRAASGAVMPAVPIATSTRWRSTPHGYVPSLSRVSSPKYGNSAIVTKPHVIPNLYYFLSSMKHTKKKCYAE